MIVSFSHSGVGDSQSFMTWDEAIRKATELAVKDNTVVRIFGRIKDVPVSATVGHPQQAV